MITINHYHETESDPFEKLYCHPRGKIWDLSTTEAENFQRHSSQIRPGRRNHKRKLNFFALPENPKRDWLLRGLHVSLSASQSLNFLKLLSFAKLISTIFHSRRRNILEIQRYKNIYKVPGPPISQIRILAMAISFFKWVRVSQVFLSATKL